MSTDVSTAELWRRSPRALGRALSLLEQGGPLAEQLVTQAWPRRGQARMLGITGSPGAGKSSLVARLVALLRGEGHEVAVLAVDPSSATSGGAVLGDRVRMGALYTDPGVFIRSMATRGAVGGIARATADALDLLDAAGFAWILLETVGVGQDEIEIAGAVDTVAVVTVPGLGDEIQAIKAGVLEIADLFVVNKCDRPGFQAAKRDLESMLAMDERQRPWIPPIVETVATLNRGIETMLSAAVAHGDWLRVSGELERRRATRLRHRVLGLLRARFDDLLGSGQVAAEMQLGGERGENPYRLAERIGAYLLPNELAVRSVRGGSDD